MNYFNRRNNYQIEYSGYEDVSFNLRKRLGSIVITYTRTYPVSSYAVSRPIKLYYKNLVYLVQKEFPSRDPLDLIANGKFYEVFAVVEMFCDLLKGSKLLKAQEEVAQAFSLSGSVYYINSGIIELTMQKDLAEKIKQTQTVLSLYEYAYKNFFEAVGNLFSRKDKPKNIVRDIYVSAEEYLKKITGESQYSSAIKKLFNGRIINSEQKTILEKLYAYRSNTKGTTHAGEKEEASESDAIWFIDTMSAQLRYINNQKGGDRP